MFNYPLIYMIADASTSEDTKESILKNLSEFDIVKSSSDPVCSPSKRITHQLLPKILDFFRRLLSRYSYKTSLEEARKTPIRDVIRDDPILEEGFDAWAEVSCVVDTI